MHTLVMGGGGWPTLTADGSLVIRVPEDYKHETQLATFRARFGNEFKETFGATDFDDNITDENWSNPTHRLEPGRTYRAHFLWCSENRGREYVIDKMNGLIGEALLVGVQGLTILHQLEVNNLPSSRIVSLDHDDRLWHAPDGTPMIPQLRSGREHTSPSLRLYRVERNSDVNIHQRILCFTKF